MAFEKLNIALVLQGGRLRPEGAQVPSLPGLWIFLSGIQAELAGRQFSDHFTFAKVSIPPLTCWLPTFQSPKFDEEKEVRVSKAASFPDCYVRTVLVIEGFSKDGDTHLPLVTNEMPTLLCHTEIKSGALKEIRQLTLYGSSVLSGNWKVSKTSTLVFYYFKPFALACLFDLSAADLVPVVGVT